MEAKLLASSGLLAEPRFRRLFKARHQEMNAMEIRTRPLTLPPSTERPTSVTIYSVQIRSKLRRGDAGEWTLAKRYSEFARFRESLLRRVRTWEQALDERARTTKQFALVSNALRKPLAPSFPRKHMRRDTKTIVHERRAGLQDFLRKLLDAYADLSVYIYNSGGMEAVRERGAWKVNEQLQSIFLELEAFLDIPAVQKEVERVQVAAILSLQDVDADNDRDDDDEGDEGTPEQDDDDGEDDDVVLTRGHVCCICLMGASECAESDGTARFKMVKLPCAHKFHEDCVIDWFNASTTCPLCRIAVASPTAASAL